MNLTAVGNAFVPFSQEDPAGPSPRQRQQLNSGGVPSERVAAGYVWAPGTELSRQGPKTGNGATARSAV